jgi:transposase InsO family protein
MARSPPCTSTRWCSDGLKFICWNGEVVRVAFALDCHDREIIGCLAATAGEIINDMMMHSVERRFAAIRTRCNGTPTTARLRAQKPVEIAVAVNLVPCVTPVESPEDFGHAVAAAAAACQGCDAIGFDEP